MTQFDAINLISVAISGFRSKNINFCMVVLNFWPRLYLKGLKYGNESNSVHRLTTYFINLITNNSNGTAKWGNLLQDVTFYHTWGALVFYEITYKFDP